MIYIVSGDIGIGKSYSLLQWVRHRTDVFGVLSPRMVYDERYFFDVRSKKVFNMQAPNIDENTISIGKYHFFKSAFKRANSIIKNSLKHHTTGYLIIDEFGKLELQSEGLHKSAELAIKSTIDSNKLHLILVVRTSLLEEIVKKYNITHYELVDKDHLSEKLI